MKVMCKLCKHNNNDEFCDINGEQDEFIDDCDGTFKFCYWHLIDFLEELQIRIRKGEKEAEKDD